MKIPKTLALLVAIAFSGSLLVPGVGFAQVRPPHPIDMRNPPHPKRSPHPRGTPRPGSPGAVACQSGGGYGGPMPPGAPPEYAHMTPPPGTLLAPPPGSYPSSAGDATAQGTQEAINEGLYNPLAPGMDPCSAPPVACKKTKSNKGSLLECLWAAARSFRNQSTAWPRTLCNDGDDDHLGNCACAAAVQHIIYLATGQMIGDYGVDSFDLLFSSGEYGARLVPPANAHRGAIVVFSKTPFVRGGTHIGFCAINGCALTWSNSSSARAFAPQDLPLYYYHPYVRIYEPTHIP